MGTPSQQRVLQLAGASQLKLSTQGSCKLRGDNTICTIRQILLMPPLVMTSNQGVQRAFLQFNYSESIIENQFLTVKMKIPFVQLVYAN